GEGAYTDVRDRAGYGENEAPRRLSPRPTPRRPLAGLGWAAPGKDRLRLSAADARCHTLHSNQMLNRGYAYTTIVSRESSGRTLLSHLASLYPHSTPQAWRQKLDNGEVTLNGIAASGCESLTSGQTLVWNRPPWSEPDAPLHFEVLFDDP